MLHLWKSVKIYKERMSVLDIGLLKMSGPWRGVGAYRIP